MHTFARKRAYGIVRTMNIKEMARLGAIATNKILTKETRSKAAKKGWRDRKKKIKVSK